MSENIPIGPHEFDHHTRLCVKCGCTVGDYATDRDIQCPPASAIPQANAPGEYAYIKAAWDRITQDELKARTAAHPPELASYTENNTLTIAPDGQVSVNGHIVEVFF